MMSCSHGHVARIVRHSQLASGVVIHVAIASVAYSTSGGAWSCGMQNGWSCGSIGGHVVVWVWVVMLSWVVMWRRLVMW